MNRSASPSPRDHEYEGSASLFVLHAEPQAKAGPAQSCSSNEAASGAQDAAPGRCRSRLSVRSSCISVPQRTCQPSQQPPVATSPRQAPPGHSAPDLFSSGRVIVSNCHAQRLQGRPCVVVQWVGPNSSVNRTRYGKAPWPRCSQGPSSASRPGRLASAGRLPLR
jgi:hypothetical protein